MSEKTCWNQERLQSLFDSYNERLWGGELPPYTVIPATLKDPEDGLLGERRVQEREILIYVDKHDSDSQLRGTLVHEMVHAASGGEHGPEFWDELRRVVAMVPGWEEQPESCRVLLRLDGEEVAVDWDWLDEMECVLAYENHKLGSAPWCLTSEQQLAFLNAWLRATRFGPPRRPRQPSTEENPEQISLAFG